MNNYRVYYRQLIKCIIMFFLLYVIYQIYQIRNLKNKVEVKENLGHSAFVQDSSGRKKEYNSETHPFIFIGGHPRSGTTLVRAMLDAHQKVRCGEETRIIPRILQLREHWFKSENEMHRLAQGGINDVVINAAVASFVLETIVQHGPPADVLCNKDPLAFKHITITGYRHDDPRACLEKWNSVMTVMNSVCNAIGPERCLVVYYEQLVLHPRRWMTIILEYLDIPWDEDVLSHHLKINKPGGVRVSAAERSSDQIVKPVNAEALTQWVGTYPKDVLEEMNEIAPMLKLFGYDPLKNPPNYGVPDAEVLNNTKDVLQNKGIWEVRQKQMVEEMKKPEPMVKIE